MSIATEDRNADCFEGARELTKLIWNSEKGRAYSQSTANPAARQEFLAFAKQIISIIQAGIDDSFLETASGCQGCPMKSHGCDS